MKNIKNWLDKASRIFGYGIIYPLIGYIVLKILAAFINEGSQGEFISLLEQLIRIYLGWIISILNGIVSF